MVVLPHRWLSGNSPRAANLAKTAQSQVPGLAGRFPASRSATAKELPLAPLPRLHRSPHEPRAHLPRRGTKTWVRE